MIGWTNRSDCLSPLFSSSVTAPCDYSLRYTAVVLSLSYCIINLVTVSGQTIRHGRGRNYTIDDSQWSTAALSLSSGWNMLRVNGSNEYINETQVSAITPYLGEFWNSSVSWTATEDSWTSLSFIGTNIWAYGMAGPNQGSFTARVDNQTAKTFSAYQSDVDYNKLLFNVSGLDDGQTHTLTFTNTGSQSFAFDYALIEMADISATPTNASASSSTIPAQAQAVTPSPSSSINAKEAAELVALSATTYTFKWNAALYFVVIFSAMIGATFIFWSTYVLIRMCLRSRPQRHLLGSGAAASAPNTDTAKNSKKDKGQAEDSKSGSSYLIYYNDRHNKRSTRLLEALRGKKISPPMVGDNGNISSGRGSRTGSGASFYGGAENHTDVEKGGMF